MPHILRNQEVTLHIDLPEENYQLTRFDWTGKITQVTFQGKSFAGTELTEPGHTREKGMGFYNEFGIESPLGFSEADPGDWCHKIGVGLIQKEGGEYDFHHLYACRPLDFELELGQDVMGIACQGELENGYAYRLEKEIHLLKQGFELRYQLHNLGEKVIDTQEYVHNFLSINGAPIGPDYRLRVPFLLQPGVLGQYINPNQVVDFAENQLSFSETPSEAFFFSNLSADQAIETSWRLENAAQQLGISERGNFACSGVNLWGMGHVISPELFIQLRIAPGEKETWQRSYRFYELA